MQTINSLIIAIYMGEGISLHMISRVLHARYTCIIHCNVPLMLMSCKYSRADKSIANMNKLTGYIIPLL